MLNAVGLNPEEHVVAADINANQANENVAEVSVF